MTTLHEQAREYARRNVGGMQPATTVGEKVTAAWLAGHEAATRTLTSDPDFDQEFARSRGKLDAVRALAEDTSEFVNNDWGWGYDAAMESVLAILDGKPA